MSYPQTNVFLICFSIGSQSSFQNVKAKWVPEIRNHSQHTPIILVGTKLDLRNENSSLNKRERDKRKEQPIKYSQSKKLAKKIGAIKYVECSALIQHSLNEVFEETVRAAKNLGKGCPKRKTPWWKKIVFRQ